MAGNSKAKVAVVAGILISPAGICAVPEKKSGPSGILVLPLIYPTRNERFPSSGGEPERFLLAFGVQQNGA